jgi:hypothetical protein
MGEVEWQSLPIGIDAAKWITRSYRRTVLVAVHSLVSGQRLMDLVELIESDERVQVVYTQAPDMFGRGVSGFLRSIGALEIPWAQARRERFDLALAAAYGGIDQLHAPVMVFAHGAGYGKRATENGATYGLDAQRLMRDGHVVPTVVVLSHEAQRDILARQCRPALAVAIVAGDPCYDRMLVSIPFRADYRRALGVRPGRELVVVTSTWGRHSVFSRQPHLPAKVMKQLDPDRYQVAAMIHPAVWSSHGHRQVRAWLTEPRVAGLTLIEPELDWRAVVLAADHVIGDHGSATAYAAALGTSVLCTDLPIHHLDMDSAQALLATHAPRLVLSQPLPEQLRRHSAWPAPQIQAAIAGRLTSVPGQSNRLLRTEMYRLLDLSVPGRHRAPDPVPVPVFERRDHGV